MLKRKGQLQNNSNDNAEVSPTSHIDGHFSKELLTGTIPVNKELLTGTVSADNYFLNIFTFPSFINLS